ncbi:hypothetical protein [Nocardioides jiangxiensis]|uniref:Uncharacterized protein n=1 Tax=Nocardioides jiangxiensis TaxID=3064524 RepID=A0ABT9AX87_9ACTN|nr:hypothetical protein [Nocardioides sp. WY-20]MDO7867140.1 hypothetical protein [Nocardioides sp. WY-20]
MRTLFQNKVLAIVAAICLVVAVGAAAALVMLPSLVTVRGALLLSDLGDPASDDGTSCIARGGYSDIGEGTQVVVRDSGGKTVSVGSLEAGTREEAYGICTYRFTVKDVSGDWPMSVEVSHRGQIVFGKDDADGVVVTLGS